MNGYEYHVHHGQGATRIYLYRGTDLAIALATYCTALAAEAKKYISMEAVLVA